MNNFEVIIGVEIHVELNTKTKMFSPAKNDFNAPPNTTFNQIDIAYPGTLPLLNKQAVIDAIMLAKALNMKIDDEMHFDRKNYFYTDLPKGYQITQFFKPIGSEGVLEIELDDNSTKQVKIERIHLEEDTARQNHDQNETKIDYNRCGVPLIEIVTHPVLRSAQEAVKYVEMIRKIVLYLGISDAKLEEGSLRADINISLRPKGYNGFGTKVEIKNMNSLNNIKKAIEFEIADQYAKINKGIKILQQTKRFDVVSNSTIPMRDKTTGVEYKYFPDPNIPIIKLSQEFIKNIKLPELPHQKMERYKKLNLNDIYLNLLINNLELSKYFDSIPYYDKEKLSKVFFAEVVSLSNQLNIPVEKLNIKVEHLAQAMDLLDKEIISGKSLKKLITLLPNYDSDLENLLLENNLKQITDESIIKDMINKIIEQNPNAISEYLTRPERAMKFILGNVMKVSNGQVSPIISDKVAKELLDEKFR
ncbi:Asp-tRNA(Asn)/Glu-tRNA(Gln) amidotransferase subunit GatB [Mycoplasma crocodyli]|uniref:Aspartyl/glutamyl-tRNA(Asn/Gln) amidotransferase subunit B n=1 Tax=Mycoplasma crocodyli (strain ATCC 51981 / MP145) TaxID=512564 RepID=D5E5U1_MYCCM|nr:Asp-tRNA(Asn)/Glu-tRNA(Gln) amidotransferase subunit GatB [Mycoplasma crocodyli]ADE19988.1 glutamyl-tRNA(Gln) and/or aspartyl-tRNA(Asn) amidotransferase, B subunit [Mycoplasma crocodyli MP145]